MKERPILFSAPMVRAILSGTKTQTRRAVKLTANGHVKEPGGHRRWHPADPDAWLACPYSQPGDRLWVRETFRRDLDRLHSRKLIEYAADDEVRDAGPSAAFDFPDIGWRPSIHMPRWASRITLEITGVRVERLQDLSEADAQAEGCSLECMTPTGDDSGSAIYGPGGYLALWESINGAGSWAVNPWVWVVDFKRIEGQEK